MIVTINDHSFNAKDVCFIDKQKTYLCVSLSGNRSFNLITDLESFFKATYLSKKDFIKLKNHFINVKKITYVGPIEDNDVVIGFNGFSRYISTAKTEHVKLVAAFKEVNNWAVTPKYESK